jgi:molybdopterin-guanine dinucleotide biosynthesis protein A
MLHHAIEAVRAVAGEVVVVWPPGVDAPLPAGVRQTHDVRPFEGPLAGLAAGLPALDLAVDRVLVVGGDMPALRPRVLMRLLEALVTHDVAVLADDARPRPLPMALRRTIGEEVDRLLALGDRRLRALIASADTLVIPPAIWQVDDPAAETLRDVDLPSDLATDQA